MQGGRRCERPRWGVFATVIGLLTGALVLASGAQARMAESLSLDVTFDANGSIVVTLPDGTPVGSTTGSPTVIPAGFYSVLMTGPGGCTDLPDFSLQGPGVNIVDNLDEGEMTNSSDGATFQPNSTYTWSDAAAPSVVYTFATSSQVEGTPPPAYTSSGSPSGELTSSSHSTASSQDLVGSSVTSTATGSKTAGSSSGSPPTLTAAVSASGGLRLTRGGRSVAALAAGRYTISVSDKGAKSSFALVTTGRPRVVLAAAAFVGRRTISVDLTAGRWFVASEPSGKHTAAITVS